MDWLADGVPITLLCDLLDPDGPPSREILAAEAVADDLRRALTEPQSAEVGPDFSAAAGD
jgi:hypothetical protein